MPVLRNLAGSTFGKWSVISYAGSGGSGASWLCRCECGTQRVVLAASLAGKRSTSCGCESRRISSERAIHGHERGGKHSPTYMTWRAMLRRCADDKHPSYMNYGGRGIKVCDEWKSFEQFLSDMGERPEGKNLDRINCDGDYTKENCRWLSNKENNNNRRNNRRLEFDGQTHTVSEWAEVLGIKEGTIRARLCRGADVARALTPVSS